MVLVVENITKGGSDEWSLDRDFCHRCPRGGVRPRPSGCRHLPPFSHKTITSMPSGRRGSGGWHRCEAGCINLGFWPSATTGKELLPVAAETGLRAGLRSFGDGSEEELAVARSDRPPSLSTCRQRGFALAPQALCFPVVAEHHLANLLGENGSRESGGCLPNTRSAMSSPVRGPKRIPLR